MFNVVTGIYAPDDGAIAFAGEDITGARPQAVYHAGITRTFQRSRLCLPLSIFDNIMIGNHRRNDYWPRSAYFRRARHEAAARENLDKGGTLVQFQQDAARACSTRSARSA